MAKFSANGNHKVASAQKTTTVDSGSIVKTAIGLRSDGRILHRIDVKLEGSDRWSRGGYSILGSLFPKGDKSSLDRFKKYAAERGYNLD